MAVRRALDAPPGQSGEPGHEADNILPIARSCIKPLERGR